MDLSSTAVEKPSSSTIETKTPDSDGFNGNRDLALELVGDDVRTIDPLVEARVVRKIDLILLPTMFLGWGLVQYDKNVLGSAAILGMGQDLHLMVVDRSTNPPTTDTLRLSWATTMIYFGILAGLYPMSFALQRFDRGRILGIVVVLWGIVCMATAGVTTYQGLYAERFFLGFVESVIPTGFMSIVSSFYTQEQQTLRQSFWYSGSGLWIIIGGAINYGFAFVDGGMLSTWQYIYLFAGGATTLFGLWSFFVPDSPMSAWFLAPEERIVAVERLRHSHTGVRCIKLKSTHIKEALLDAKLLLLFLMMAGTCLANGALGGFGPLIVTTFGYTSNQALLLQFPCGFFTFVTIFGAGWLSSRFENIRIILLILNCLFVITGAAMMWKSDWYHHAPLPIVGYTLIGSFGAVVNMLIALGISNVGGATKKSFVSASTFVAYCLGNIIAPQLVRSQTKAQHYPLIFKSMIVVFCFVIAGASILYYLLWSENRRRDAMHITEEERRKYVFSDLTDKQNPLFRYVL